MKGWHEPGGGEWMVYVMALIMAMVVIRLLLWASEYFYWPGYGWAQAQADAWHLFATLPKAVP